LLEGTNISTDESALTGEPDHLKKEGLTDKNISLNPDAYLLSGSQVMSGTGKAVILAVGENTIAGKTQSMLEQEAVATPLQVKLERIADDIGKVGVYCAILTFTACFANLVISTVLAGTDFFVVETAKQVVDFLIIGITIVVVAVPEGLPMAVTISLAYSVHKMRQEQNLVRQLSASETMGGAQEICTDKTGTLTQNKMTVVEIYAEDSI
jgi:Ca2+ transporting ATPase